jgi:RNA recognition motif-containing protein
MDTPKGDCLYVEGVLSKKELDRLFSRFGGLTKSFIATHKSGRSLGWGRVAFLNHSDAVTALDGMNGQWFRGREIHCHWWREKPSPVECQPEDERSASSRDEKSPERAPAARDISQVWCPYFMISSIC